MNRVFIVSTGRTGTKALANVFGATPSVQAAHETLPPFQRAGVKKAQEDLSDFSVWRVKQLFRLSRTFPDDIHVRETHPVYEEEKLRGEFPWLLKGFSPTNIMYNLFHRVWLRTTTSPQHIVEANHFLFSMIDIIRECYPQASIVHIIRDGRGFVKSALNKGFYSEKDFRPRLRGDTFESMTTETWEKMNRIERLGWLWTTVNEYIEGQHPDLTVHFEDLFDTNHTGIKHICEETNLPYDPQITNELLSDKINTTKRDLFTSFGELPSRLQESFWSQAEHAMTKYGYS